RKRSRSDGRKNSPSFRSRRARFRWDELGGTEFRDDFTITRLGQIFDLRPEGLGRPAPARQTLAGLDYQTFGNSTPSGCVKSFTQNLDRLDCQSPSGCSPPATQAGIGTERPAIARARRHSPTPPEESSLTFFPTRLFRISRTPTV